MNSADVHLAGDVLSESERPGSAHPTYYSGIKRLNAKKKTTPTV